MDSSPPPAGQIRQNPGGPPRSLTGLLGPSCSPRGDPLGAPPAVAWLSRVWGGWPSGGWLGGSGSGSARAGLPRTTQPPLPGKQEAASCPLTQDGGAAQEPQAVASLV